MTKKGNSVVEFDEDSDQLDVAEQLIPGSQAAVVSGTDWTAETIVSQLKKGNIKLNPRFQRRDAWKRDRKSRFIESLIVGLPIPQIVLAESIDSVGKFIVLDGKQRLLAIMQYWGLADGESENNAYELSGLPLRKDLNGVSFKKLSKLAKYENDYSALCNQSVRTVVIRSWKTTSFLHTVFLRLNTGSVSLSPQELRQALIPGPFTDYLDDAASESVGLMKLLGTSGPDPRMRDIEILARFIAFRLFATDYPGRMKRFLDDSFKAINKHWDSYESQIKNAVKDFEAGVAELLHVFGDDVARKPGSPQFNRAIFDALIYYHAQPKVRKMLSDKRNQVKNAYGKLFSPESGFTKAIESDTAGSPNTSARLSIWAKELSAISGKKVSPPAFSRLVENIE